MKTFPSSKKGQKVLGGGNQSENELSQKIKNVTTKKERKKKKKKKEDFFFIISKNSEKNRRIGFSK